MRKSNIECVLSNIECGHRISNTFYQISNAEIEHRMRFIEYRMRKSNVEYLKIEHRMRKSNKEIGISKYEINFAHAHITLSRARHSGPRQDERQYRARGKHTQMNDRDYWQPYYLPISKLRSAVASLPLARYCRPSCLGPEWRARERVICACAEFISYLDIPISVFDFRIRCSIFI